ncbi:ABC transporter permease [Bradyrhizobium uaiense]|uniref:ABC transporter permease n=1 Tax=Bradyrhizobium uaiense TaxID=2594946 RepID=A0A6P1BTY6_9BRAD|nr:hypothetical protein [Bradyrhizobium uaiense]NEV01886.1 hypothetical protein [Bradyrhizobium uaiense]
MTDASLLSAPADAAATRTLARKEAPLHGSETVVTIMADVRYNAAIFASSASRGVPWRSLFLPWLPPLALLAIWHALSVSGVVSTAIVPAPADIWNAARQLAERGELQHDILISLRRVAIGFGIGAAAGLILGLLVGLFVTVRDLLDRSLQMIRTIPHLALVPLMILWFCL